MANLDNIGVPQVANRAIIPIAIQAGLADLVAALVPMATNRLTLLVALVAELEKAQAYALGQSTTPPHATLNLAVLQDVLLHTHPGEIYQAINTDVLTRLLDYIDADIAAPVMSVSKLPDTLHAPGPAIVTAERDPEDASALLILFSEPPLTAVTDAQGNVIETLCEYELYLNLRLVRRGSEAPVGGMVCETLPNVPATVAQLPHSIRVLFVDGDGCLSQFGPTALVV